MRGSGRCWLCGEPVALIWMTLDHVIPVAHGGSNAQANLRPAHLECNQSRGSSEPVLAQDEPD